MRIADGLLYTGELAGFVHCLNARTGEQYWDYDLNAATWSSPYCVDGKVYFGDDGDKITVFEQGKKLNVLGEIDMGSKVRATPSVANGVLYVLTENKLYAIKGK